MKEVCVVQRRGDMTKSKEEIGGPIVVTISGSELSGKNVLASEIYTHISDLGFTLHIKETDRAKWCRPSPVHSEGLETVRTNPRVVVTITTGDKCMCDQDDIEFKDLKVGMPVFSGSGRFDHMGRGRVEAIGNDWAVIRSRRGKAFIARPDDTFGRPAEEDDNR